MSTKKVLTAAQVAANAVKAAKKTEKAAKAAKARAAAPVVPAAAPAVPTAEPAVVPVIAAVPLPDPTVEGDIIVPAAVRWGLRLRFVTGQVLSFEWDGGAAASAIAEEIRFSLALKVDILNMKDANGKRYCKAANVLPKRKMFLDVVRDGQTVRTGLYGVELEPGQIFAKDRGAFFASRIAQVIAQGEAMAQRGRFVTEEKGKYIAE